MQRVSRSSAVAQPPAPPANPGAPGYFTGGDPISGFPATVPGYEWFNAVQEELIAIVSAAGLSPDWSDNAQALAALRGMFGGSATTITANASLTPAQAGLVVIDAGSEAVTATLPAASAAPVGGRYFLLRLDGSANAATVTAAGGSTVNGAASLSLSGALTGAILFSDGVRWRGFSLGALSRLGLGAGLEDDGSGSARVRLADSTLTRTASGLSVTSGLVVPAGCVAHFAMSSPPTGWLKANGAVVSRTTYAALFAAIGTTFGVGNGSTTFATPDLRGEFLRCWDDGRGIDAGRGFGGGQTDAFQGHWHSTVYNYGILQGAAGGGVYDQAESNPASTHAIARARGAVSDGSNGTPRIGAETRPRNIALLACIKF